MPSSGPFSLGLRALLVYAYGPFLFVSFKPVGPWPVYCLSCAILNVSLHDLLFLLSLNIARHLDSSKFVFYLDMSIFCLGSLSAPPRLQPLTQLLTIEGPPPEALIDAPAPHPQLQPPPLPQAVVVEEATQDDLNQTYKYWIEGDGPEVASNAVVVIDAATQYSRPSSRPGSAAASPAPSSGFVSVALWKPL